MAFATATYGSDTFGGTNTGPVKYMWAQAKLCFINTGSLISNKPSFIVNGPIAIESSSAFSTTRNPSVPSTTSEQFNVAIGLQLPNLSGPHVNYNQADTVSAPVKNLTGYSLGALDRFAAQTQYKGYLITGTDIAKAPTISTLTVSKSSYIQGIFTMSVSKLAYIISDKSPSSIDFRTDAIAIYKTPTTQANESSSVQAINLTLPNLNGSHLVTNAVDTTKATKTFTGYIPVGTDTAQTSSKFTGFNINADDLAKKAATNHVGGFIFGINRNVQSNINAYIPVNPAVSSSHLAYIRIGEPLTATKKSFIAGPGVSSSHSLYIQSTTLITATPKLVYMTGNYSISAPSKPGFIFGVYKLQPTKLSFINGLKTLNVSKTSYIEGIFWGIDRFKLCFMNGVDPSKQSNSQINAYIQAVITTLTGSKLLYIEATGLMDSWPLNDGTRNLGAPTVSIAYDLYGLDNGTYTNGVTPTDGPFN